MIEPKYMRRRKFIIPTKERVRDYMRKDVTPSDFLFKCDYDEVDEDEE